MAVPASVKIDGKANDEKVATAPMTREQQFAMCAAGIEIMGHAMTAEKGVGISTSEHSIQKLYGWLALKANECLKETDGIKYVHDVDEIHI